jgi:pimeloyl-ACP methyl ester carboxylesterase
MSTADVRRSAYVDLPDSRLHYLEWGELDAPAVVLLHGAGALATAHVWESFAISMLGAHRVIALDQRGFGSSDHATVYSFELMARDLEQFVERLELNTFSLVGHSMGAMVAAIYAERGPAELRRLVLEDTVPTREGQRSEGRPAVRWEFADMAELLAVVRQNGLAGTDEELHERFDPALRRLDGGRVAFRADRAVQAAVRAQMAEPDPAWFRDLRKIRVPTLVVRGAASEALSSEALVAAAALIPDCRVVEVANAGHIVHDDNLADFLTAVRGFLDYSSRA